MEISREDAGRALQDIGQTADRVHSLRYYRAAAPYFIIWGLVWMIANPLTAWMPAAANRIWMVMAAIGTIASIAVSFLAPARRSQNEEVARAYRQRGQRFGFSFAAIIGFFVLSSIVMPPWQYGRQVNAYISLFWALIYVLAGVWNASRIAWLGVLLAAAVMIGFIGFPAYFSLWMGIVGGGLLLGTGLWLLKA